MSGFNIQQMRRMQGFPSREETSFDGLDGGAA